ncbi:hypothetical protein QBC43DRAFT_306823 [Cladorrhinum sp. PSN259]|nr:hypothetical protein QBC43DRAFT_306823 [Cladorrhinum sp. PSN259]
MEFRPVVRRLPGVRNALTLTQSRPFTSDSKLEAAAAAAVAPSPSSQTQTHTQTRTQTRTPGKPTFTKPPPLAQIRAESLRKQLETHTMKLPPRPAIFTRTSFFDSARAQSNTNSANTPSSGSSLLSNMRADMDKSTAQAAESAVSQSGYTNWQMSDFLKRHNFQTVEMRLRPSTGRTIPVQGSVDVARAFKILEGNCRANGVKFDARLQKFHERPALKRKRQRRERWKERFRQGFSATISRVMELRGQGW